MVDDVLLIFTSDADAICHNVPDNILLTTTAIVDSFWIACLHFISRKISKSFDINGKNITQHSLVNPSKVLLQATSIIHIVSNNSPLTLLPAGE